LSHAQLAIMTVFDILFVPETKGLPVERIQVLFARHWFWRRWAGPASFHLTFFRHAAHRWQFASLAAC
jgi:hypothetical protein